MPPDAASPDDAYAALQARVREAVTQTLGADDVGLVVSRGDPDLVHVPGRTLWHFPRHPSGAYAGFYPSDDAEAILHLRHVMLAGVTALVLPEASFWWQASYPEFFAYVERRFRVAYHDEQTCSIYRRRSEDRPAGERDDRADPAATSAMSSAQFDAAVEALLAASHDPERRAQLRRLVAYLLKFEALSDGQRDEFLAWEELGLHVVPASYHSPIPHVGEADQTGSWDARSTLAGIAMNDEAQQAFLARLAETKRTGVHDAFWGAVSAVANDPANLMFNGIDAHLYAAMLLEHRPRRIVEIGAGYSTLIALAYRQHVGAVEITCIEPAPPGFLDRLSPAEITLVRQPVQTVDLGIYRALEAGDVLFYDGSHVSKLGSDVHHVFFSVLPLLQPGVLVHIHDVFLPREYPRDLTVPHRHFWNEQYLLQAFLMFDAAFEVVLGASYLHDRFPGLLSAAFGGVAEAAGGSFWLRRLRALP